MADGWKNYNLGVRLVTLWVNGYHVSTHKYLIYSYQFYLRVCKYNSVPKF